MHLCTAFIALGGDTNNVVFRGPDNPVSWPEVGVIQFLHGEEAVYNIEAIQNVERRGVAEKDRLVSIYGPIVDQLYPGKNPVMEMEMPGVELPTPASEGAAEAKPAPKAKRTLNLPSVDDTEV